MNTVDLPHRINDSHTLYRMFDTDGALIYVGCTLDLPTRMKFHQQQSWWSPQYHSMTTETYPNRPEAHAAEIAAIAVENPRWNIMHRSYSSSTWTKQNYRDYIKAIENQPDHMTDHRRSRLNKAKRLHRPASRVMAVVTIWSTTHTAPISFDRISPTLVQITTEDGATQLYNAADLERVCHSESAQNHEGDTR